MGIVRSPGEALAVVSVLGAGAGAWFGVGYAEQADGPPVESTQEIVTDVGVIAQEHPSGSLYGEEAQVVLGVMATMEATEDNEQVTVNLEEGNMMVHASMPAVMEQAESNLKEAEDSLRWSKWKHGTLGGLALIGTAFVSVMTPRGLHRLLHGKQ